MGAGGVAMAGAFAACGSDSSSPSGTGESTADAGAPKQGGNFRLETSLGVLDIMQWLPGIEAEHAYETLARDALEAPAFGVKLQSVRFQRCAG